MKKLTAGFNVIGTFTDVKTVSGVLSLDHYYIDSCGTVSGGPYEWSSIWKNNSQPQLKILEDGFSIIPSEDEFGEPFIFEVQK